MCCSVGSMVCCSVYCIEFLALGCMVVCWVCAGFRMCVCVRVRVCVCVCVCVCENLFVMHICL